MMTQEPDSSNLVYIGLGSNLGDREGMLNNALKLLQLEGFSLTQASRLYETPPWGVTEQPPFLNQVVEGTWAGTPESLLKACLDVERKLGRVRAVRYGPRVVDLDVLAFDRFEIQTEDLQIPHPRLAERAFVLVPWAEIAPFYILPGLDKSTEELLKLLPRNEVEAVKMWKNGS